MVKRTEIKVRPAGFDDAEDIARLISLLGYPSTPQQMRARLTAMTEDKKHATFVAEVGGNVVGMVGALVCRIYEEDAAIGRVIALGVDDRLRGQGLGAALMGAAEQWLSSRGVETVLVNSGLAREEAHRFYQGVGYALKGKSFVRKLS